MYLKWKMGLNYLELIHIDIVKFQGIKRYIVLYIIVLCLSFAIIGISSTLIMSEIRTLISYCHKNMICVRNFILLFTKCVFYRMIAYTETTTGPSVNSVL